MLLRTCLICLAAAFGGAANAQETRQLHAHEHGVGRLNIALEDESMAIELEAPGFDIVGFEHAARSEEDRKAVEVALARLGDVAAEFLLPEAAKCRVRSVDAGLVGDDHDDHGNGQGDAHDHDATEDLEGQHTEFRATYRMVCADPAALDSIDFPYFDTFPNARELEAQIVTDAGAVAGEVTRDGPRFALE